MRVILTGGHQIGKSTLCQRLADNLRRRGFSVGGVWTETQNPGPSPRLILHEVASETARPLAGEDLIAPGPRFGAMQYSAEAIYAGIKAIGRGAQTDLLIVDEVGALEMQWQKFFPVLHILKRTKHVLLVIRPELVAHVSALLKLKEDYELVLATVDNRAEVLRDLTDRFAAAIASAKWS